MLMIEITVVVRLELFYHESLVYIFYGFELCAVIYFYLILVICTLGQRKSMVEDM